MVRCLLILPALLLAFAFAPAADDKDFKPLFNGKDLTGWKIHPKPSGSIEEVIAKEKDGKVVAFDGKLKDGKTVHALARRGRHPRRRRPAQPPLQRARRLRELPLPRRGARSTTRATAASTSAPSSAPASPRATRPRSTPPTATRSRPAACTHRQRRRRTRRLVLNDAPHKPDEWFTQEVIANGNQITSWSTARRRSISRTDEEDLHQGPLRPAGPRPRHDDEVPEDRSEGTAEELARIANSVVREQFATVCGWPLRGRPEAIAGLTEAGYSLCLWLASARPD